MVNEVLDFQNALVRVSYGTDHMSVGKRWSVQVTMLGANTGHLKKTQNIVKRRSLKPRNCDLYEKNPKNWDRIA